MAMMKLFPVVLSLYLCTPVHAWAPGSNLHQPSFQSRRTWLENVSAVTAVTMLINASPAVAATSSPLVEELKEVQTKLRAIPALLDEQEWDKARTILKTPPVNKLWNLGDSQNTLLKLAKESGNVELFELKDELAYSLQTCDQLIYNNVFVYFQPGNGKIDIKGPKDILSKAMSQVQQAIDES